MSENPPEQPRNPIFSKGHLPNFNNAKKYRKKTAIRAMRIAFPFTVETDQKGKLHCKDGYLALDDRGYPYPIGKEEFEKLYVEEKDGLFK